MKRKILVTSALPYANGSIHLGHLVKYIQTDIWVRFQKMRGHDFRYLCADDTHGTPMYDPVKNLFLPDRFIKGECPKCGAADQYGDNCEVCGATYSPTELKNPVSAVSGATPVHKDSEHYFFKLGACAALLCA